MCWQEGVLTVCFILGVIGHTLLVSVLFIIGVLAKAGPAACIGGLIVYLVLRGG